MIFNKKLILITCVFLYILCAVYYFSQLFNFSDFPIQDELNQLKAGMGMTEYFTSSLYTLWLKALGMFSQDLFTLMKVNFIVLPILVSLTLFYFHYLIGVSTFTNLFINLIFVSHSIHYEVERKIVFFACLLLYLLFICAMKLGGVKKNIFLILGFFLISMSRIEMIILSLFEILKLVRLKFKARFFVLNLIVVLTSVTFFIVYQYPDVINLIKISLIHSLPDSALKEMSNANEDLLSFLMMNPLILAKHYLMSFGANFLRLILVIINPVYVNNYGIFLAAIVFIFGVKIVHLSDLKNNFETIIKNQTKYLLRSLFILFIIISLVRFNYSYFPYFLLCGLSFLAQLLNFKAKHILLNFLMYVLIILQFLFPITTYTNTLNESHFMYPHKSKGAVRKLVNYFESIESHEKRQKVLSIEDFSGLLKRDDLEFSTFHLITKEAFAKTKFVLKIEKPLTRDQSFDYMVIDENALMIKEQIDSSIFLAIEKNYKQIKVVDRFIIFKHI